ncbi:hypothetical protein ACFQ1Q_05955 [Winogradskyella litorisediminis]|uniref:Oxygen tolerance protein BatD n=1 Tax=Winogradskyella litorisediminis TaxID=1156618 RepID=A0ABW3N532_9FLAO
MLFFLISNFSFSQVTTEIDTTSIRIGEQISYKIKVETDSTNLVVFPEGQTFLPLELVEALTIDTTRQASKFQLLREYKLTQFDSGSYYIPRQKVIVGDNPFFTDSLKIEVNTIQVDTTKQGLYDIKPIIEVEKSSSKWWLYVLIVLAAIVLVAFLLYWFIWRKKPLTEEEEIALLPPYERAKLAMAKLDEKQYLVKEDLKGFYSELTFIIRKFLDEKVYDRALESTTDELVDRLRLLSDGNQIKLDAATISNIETIFKRADLVKFAKSKPDVALAELDKNTIDKELENVKLTLPEPSEEEKLLDQQYKEAKERKQKTKKILLTVAISVFLLIATFVGFGATYGFGYVKDKLLGHDSMELLEGEWVKSAYGFPPIYIETPKVLKRQTIELPKEAEGKVKNTTFGYGSLLDDFYVFTSTTIVGEQKEEDAEVQKAMNITKVIEGAIKAWEVSGVQNIITKNEEFVTPNEAQGVKTFGTADFPTSKEGRYQESEYVLLSFTTEQVIQQVILVWRADDKYADDIVERIIDSVELNENVKREEETK